MTIYVTADEVQQFNERFVGPDMLRDFGLLESAALRPQSSAFGDDAYPTIREKAAALLHGLTRNHPFIRRQQAHRLGGHRSVLHD